MENFTQDCLYFRSFFNPMMQRKELRVDGINGTIPKLLTIPSEVQGLPVTVIGQQVFRHCKSLEQVDYPDSIYCFEDECFSRCENLQFVSSYQTKNPAEKVDIFHFAFYKCANLLSFQSSFPTSVFYEAFHGCKKLHLLEAPISGFGSFAFHETALTELHLHDDVLWCKESFSGMSNLKDIYFAGKISNDVRKTYLQYVKKRSLQLHINPNKFNYKDWVYEGVNIVC